MSKTIKGSDCPIPTIWNSVKNITPGFLIKGWKHAAPALEDSSARWAFTIQTLGKRGRDMEKKELINF